jgi:hypothetical protein
MNRAAPPDKQFEPFLHAVIHEDPDQPALTVLSALARRDLDPWDEAASLADLAPEAAIVKLVVLLKSLPPGQRPPDVMLAARLQALLPRTRTSNAPTPPASMKAAWQPARQLHTGPAAVEVEPRSNFSYLLVYLVFVAILIGSEWLNASGEGRPATTADHGAASAAAPAAAPAATGPAEATAAVTPPIGR